MRWSRCASAAVKGSRRFSIDGAPGRRLKGANFVCVEARLHDGFKDNGVHQSLLSPFLLLRCLFLRSH